jgi:hypothetical protein
LTPEKEWWEPFLTALEQTGNVSAAARAAGIVRQNAYLTRANHPAFAAAWEEALEVACDALELEARKRAMEGESDVLMIFLLKAHRPEKYRERVQTEKTGAVTVHVVYEDLLGQLPGQPAPVPDQPPGV